MQFLLKPLRFRPSKEVLEKANILIKEFPELYKNFSDVVRSGIMMLYKIKKGE